MANRYVAIEGNIGAGKTSLVKALGKRWDCKLLLEQFEDNPFLPSFYENPEKYAFPLEMSFLAERYQQISRSVQQTDLFADLVLADYMPHKSLIFAGKTLDHAEYGVYKKMHQLLYVQLPQPDIVIYIHRPLSVLRKQIEERGRVFEKEIKSSYLESLEEGYFEYFRGRPELVTLVVEPAGDRYAWDSEFHQRIEDLLEWNWSPGLHVVEAD